MVIASRDLARPEDDPPTRRSPALRSRRRPRRRRPARAPARRRGGGADRSFDRVQLAETIRICRGSRSLSEAGRTLFAASRLRRSSANDADRLRKYLARFGLDWAAVSADR
ncbi:MAG TPA: hypothetical protein VMS43_17010 [Allosphingosinicella sp.]|nr:hypothetical protein [Allosphingosinicella sp.]